MEDTEELKKQAEQKAKEELSHPNELNQYIIDTFKNFAFRYLLLDEPQVQTPQDGLFLVENILQESARDIKNMIMANLNLDNGQIEIIAVVHRGAPDFAPQSNDQEIKKVIFKFDDLLHFRNEFPAYLEEACEVF